MPLSPGWVNYKEGVPQDPSYQGALLFKEGDLCVVSGLVLTKMPGGIPTQPQVLVLPENCRPKERLIFNLNNHAVTERFDVLPNGQVLWVAGTVQQPWISLSGIVFSTGAAKPEPFDLRWTRYDDNVRWGRRPPGCEGVRGRGSGEDDRRRWYPFEATNRDTQRGVSSGGPTGVQLEQPREHRAGRCLA